MKIITATLAAALLFGVAGNALAAYSTEGTVTPANSIITVIGPADSLGDNGIVTVIGPEEESGNNGLVTVIEPMDFSFTQLAYSQGFFFDTADTFGSGSSRMATIGSSSIRMMGSYLPSSPTIITIAEPSSPGIITIIGPSDATPVPVPPALFLMGSGLAGIAGLRRKRVP